MPYLALLEKCMCEHAGVVIVKKLVEKLSSNSICDV